MQPHDKLASWNPPASQGTSTTDSPATPGSKASRFNARSLQGDGRLVLYNSYTGHQCVIPASATPKAVRYLSKQPVRGELDGLGEYLTRKGYLLPNETDEEGRLDVAYGQQQFRSDVLQLVLIPSEDCNFRCIYCAQQFKQRNMPLGILNGVKKLVSARVSRLSGLSIYWFGGEPLLGYDVISELAPFFQEITQDHGVAFRSNMSTNGYLLTPDKAVQLIRWGVTSYQITIDGTEEEHNRHRPLQDGGPTYGTILRNVVAMKDFKEQFSIRLRINFDNKNVNKVGSLFQEMRAKVGDDPRYIFDFHAVGQWGGKQDADLDVCTAREINSHFVQLSEQAQAAGFRTPPFSDRLVPVEANVCYAARPYNFVIGADGTVMKCTVALDYEDANVVGSLTEDGALHLDKDKFVRWVKPYYRADAECQKCFFVPVCQGASCPLRRIKFNARPCPNEKTAIQQTLKFALAEKTRRGIHHSVLINANARTSCDSRP